MSNDANGQLIRGHFNEKSWGCQLFRRFVAVLTLPPTFEKYISGRSKQALRTNVRKASKGGIICSHTRCHDEIRDAALWVTRDWSNSWDSQLQNDSALAAMMSGAEGYIAYNDRREPIQLSLFLVDTDVAYLFWSHAKTTDEERPCRYLLHAEIVRDFILRRKRYVLVENVLRLPSGLQYFQARLGFSPAHIRFHTEPIARSIG